MIAYPLTAVKGTPTARRYRRRARVWLIVTCLVLLLVLVGLVLAASSSHNGSSPGPSPSPSPTDWPAWIAAMTGVLALLLSVSQTTLNYRRARRQRRQEAESAGYQPDGRGYL